MYADGTTTADGGWEGREDEKRRKTFLQIYEKCKIRLKWVLSSSLFLKSQENILNEHTGI